MLDMVSHCVQWGSKLCNFIICCCQAFHFWQLHIVAFAWVWYIVHFFLYLCFQFLVFNFQLQYSYLKVHVSTSYMCSSSMRLQSFQLHYLSAFSFLAWNLSTFFMCSSSVKLQSFSTLLLKRCQFFCNKCVNYQLHVCMFSLNVKL